MTNKAAKITIDAVSVHYIDELGNPTSAKSYTYKALSVASYRKGDIVLVDVPKKGLCEARVSSVANFALLPPVPFEYKWIVAGSDIDGVLEAQGLPPSPDLSGEQTLTAPETATAE